MDPGDKQKFNQLIQQGNFLSLLDLLKQSSGKKEIIFTEEGFHGRHLTARGTMLHAIADYFCQNDPLIFKNFLEMAIGILVEEGKCDREINKMVKLLIDKKNNKVRSAIDIVKSSSFISDVERASIIGFLSIDIQGVVDSYRSDGPALGRSNSIFALLQPGSLVNPGFGASNFSGIDSRYYKSQR